jgi:hypothetical protein
MSYVCTAYDKRVEAIPDDAVQITPGQRGINSFRFSDGTVHHLRHDASRGNIGKSLHVRWHKTNKKLDCIYCYPPPEPVEVVEVVQVLEALPEPPQSEVAVVAKVEPTSMTAMEAAFRRSLKS